MNDYLLQRLRADAAHLLSLAENERKLKHPGVKGRFRELLIDNILSPWLPPDVLCGTGMILASNNERKEATQDDVVLYAKGICPPILVSKNAPEGIFLVNSVLARIEVKSWLNKTELTKFVRAAQEIATLQLAVRDGCTNQFTGTLNFLFAYKSDLTPGQDSELKRLILVMSKQSIDPLSGIVSMLCVPGGGFYKIGVENGNRVWQKHLSNDPLDHIAWFVACLSNSCFEYLIQRQGRNSTNSLEVGVGFYLDHPFEAVNL
ncbi:hypothetical protein QUA81_08950 [Microcoleus sp. F6_B4]